jgi:hypothetical protein
MKCNIKNSFTLYKVCSIILLLLLAGCGGGGGEIDAEALTFSLGDNEIKSIRVEIEGNRTFNQTNGRVEVTPYSIPGGSPLLQIQTEIRFEENALIPDATYLQCGNTSIFPNAQNDRWFFESSISPVSECALYVDNREITPHISTGITKQVLVIDGETYEIGGDSVSSCQYTSTNLSIEVEGEKYQIDLPSHIYITDIDKFRVSGAIEVDAPQSLLVPNMICYGARSRESLGHDYLPGDYAFTAQRDDEFEEPYCILGVPRCSLLSIIEWREQGG